MPKIISIKIHHQGTFESLLKAALAGERCLKHGGKYWQSIGDLGRGRRGKLYRQSPDILTWIQQRVEAYEYHLYRRLLTGHCGRDGRIRARTRLLRTQGGVYRSARPHGPATL